MAFPQDKERKAKSKALEKLNDLSKAVSYAQVDYWADRSDFNAKKVNAAYKKWRTAYEKYKAMPGNPYPIMGRGAVPKEPPLNKPYPQPDDPFIFDHD